MTEISKKRQRVKELEAKQKQRFGLRKLSVGVASVLLGTTFLFGYSTIAHADELKQNEPVAVQAERTSGCAR